MRTLLASFVLALSVPVLAAEPAKLAQPAPDFTLVDLDGRTHTLSEYRGKIVVLEWFNPGCPYVVNAHTKGSLVDLGARQQKAGVVWLAVNSAAPGKQGYGVEANRAAAADWKMGYPVLLDETGAVGKAYGATNTPHMFVITRDGKLAYRGAIDNSPDGEQGSPQGGWLVDHVSEVVVDLTLNRPVRNRETKPYGCSVKYAN